MSPGGAVGISPQVIFLVGPAHSGKTEVAAGLRGLPDTVVVRHAYFWRDQYGRRGRLSGKEELARCLDRLGRDAYLVSAGVDRNTLTRFAESGGVSYGSLFLHATVEANRNLAASSSTPARLVIQIGGLEHRALDVSEDLPDAIFVHTIRDPRQYFGESRSRLGRLGWRLAAWGTSAASATRNSEALSDRYIVVRGEDLIERPDYVSRSISILVGVEVRLGSGSLLQKGRPLSTHRTPIVERLVGRQLQEIGYAVEQSPGQMTRTVTAVDAGAYLLHRGLSSLSGQLHE